MFRPVSPKLNINQMEESILELWKKEDVFQKTMQHRDGKPE